MELKINTNYYKDNNKFYYSEKLNLKRFTKKYIINNFNNNLFNIVFCVIGLLFYFI